MPENKTKQNPQTVIKKYSYHERSTLLENTGDNSAGVETITDDLVSLSVSNATSEELHSSTKYSFTCGAI